MVENVEKIRLSLERVTNSPVDSQEVEEWLNLDADKSEVYVVEIEKDVERNLQEDDIEEEENDLELESDDNLADQMEWCGLDTTLNMIRKLENVVSHPDCTEVLGDIYSKTLDVLHCAKNRERSYKTEKGAQNRSQLTLHDFFQ